MHTQVKLPLYISWRKLKDVLGWPYSRAQTQRLETDPRYAHDPFPRPGKIGSHRNNHPIPMPLGFVEKNGSNTVLTLSTGRQENRTTWYC